jgi:hypothetical protein
VVCHVHISSDHTRNEPDGTHSFSIWSRQLCASGIRQHHGSITDYTRTRASIDDNHKTGYSIFLSIYTTCPGKTQARALPRAQHPRPEKTKTLSGRRRSGGSLRRTYNPYYELFVVQKMLNPSENTRASTWTPARRQPHGASGACTATAATRRCARTISSELSR